MKSCKDNLEIPGMETLNLALNQPAQKGLSEFLSLSIPGSMTQGSLSPVSHNGRMPQTTSVFHYRENRRETIMEFAQAKACQPPHLHFSPKKKPLVVKFTMLEASLVKESPASRSV